GAWELFAIQNTRLVTVFVQLEVTRLRSSRSAPNRDALVAASHRQQCIAIGLQGIHQNISCLAINAPALACPYPVRSADVEDKLRRKAAPFRSLQSLAHASGPPVRTDNSSPDPPRDRIDHRFAVVTPLQ